MTCEHAHLTQITNDAQYRFMTSYKEGSRPYICERCGDIFWVKPLVITLIKGTHVVHGPLPPIEPGRDSLRDAIPWDAIGGKSEIEHNDH